MRFSILGPLQVHDAAGAPVGVGGARLRALLVSLLLHPGRTVGVERLTDTIWGWDETPAAAGNALQALVSRLRRALGEEVRIHGEGSGYRLEIAPEQVDLHVFEASAARGRAYLTSGRPEEAEAALAQALSLWRGPALPDLTVRGRAEDLALRLTEIHRTAVEDLLEARLDLGRYTEALPEAEAAAGRDPHRERPVELLMRALAGGGRTAEALDAYESFRSRLAEELGLDPSSRLRRAHLDLLRGESAATPENAVERNVRPPATPSVRLPRPLTDFVPRENEVGATVERLSGSRVVTLIGPGGAGKTRLAAESAETLAERSPGLVSGGVRWVELAPVGRGTDLHQVVADTLELREYAVIRANTGAAHLDPAERVASHLGDRPFLLVLDNCEHLIAEAAELAESLLARCPGLRVLATSREPLGVSGEVLLPVPPLDLPPEGADLELARSRSAVRLFTERAEAVRPGFRVSRDNLAHVVRITRELDGMPLALELAAARLRMMTPGQLAERLTDRFRLLTNGSRSALPRHRTLRAVVDWSWELLDEAERRLLRRLAVFPGGAGLEAVERVGSDPGEEAEDGVLGRDVWSVLFALVDKSLVVAENPVRDDAPPTYRQSETVRAYALERLAESGEEERVREAHARYVVDLWRRADPELRGPEQASWLARLGTAVDDCHTAFHWAIERRDAELALDLVEYTQWYWALDGGRSRNHLWAEAALDLVGDEAPRGRETAYAMCLFSLDEGVERGQEGILALLSEVERLLRAGERETGRHPSLALCLVYGAITDGRVDGPWRTRLEEELEGADDPWTRALLYLMTAMLDATFGEIGRSRERAGLALEGMRALGDVWGQCNALAQLVDVCFHTDPERCGDLLSEGIGLAERSGLKGIVALFRILRAQTLVELGRIASAEEDLETVTGTPLEKEHLVTFRMTRVMWLQAAGRQEEARRLVDETEPVVVGLGGLAPIYIEPAWRGLTADVALADGDVARAWKEAGRAWWLAGRGLSTYKSEILEIFARIVVDSDPERAVLLLGHAATLRGGLPSRRPRTLRLGERLVEVLGEERFARLWSEGADTPPPEASARVGEWLERIVPDDVEMDTWAR
ncbi:BTAD domain-containing putative transcriptional regulator [Nocardiopsis alba]|uniref:BTAD domain-containing putative transcriptional regulator n=1 Tax=Nocardiopsis alba TaxID=53437 RepID=UPI00366C452C